MECKSAKQKVFFTYDYAEDISNLNNFETFVFLSFSAGTYSICNITVLTDQTCMLEPTLTI